MPPDVHPCALNEICLRERERPLLCVAPIDGASAGDIIEIEERAHAGLEHLETLLVLQDARFADLGGDE